MEYAELWTKANEGDELTKSERFVFHQLVELKNKHHFFAFGRRVMLGTGDPALKAVHVAAMAGFLHRHPAAYAYWRSELLTGEAVAVDWVHQVSEAVAALGAMEKTSAA